MYIAFKWLLGLALAMWLLMCGVDMFFIAVNKTNRPGPSVKDVENVYKNISIRTYEESKQKLINVHNQSKCGFGLYALLCGTGFVISVFNMRKKIMLLASLRKGDFETWSIRKYINVDDLKRTAIAIQLAIFKYLFNLWRKTKRIFRNWYVYEPNNYEFIISQDITKQTLIKKLKDLREETKKLSLLLATAICENRNIKVTYQLESMAKNRLEVYMRESEKKRRLSQSQYLNFQQLYTITHQENLYLHSRIKQLTELKENAEKNLLTLVHEICLSKNEKLMAYCSRFVVQTKEELLSSDMSTEVQNFLTNSQLSQCHGSGTNTEGDNSKCLRAKKTTPSSSQAPRLVGLPGERIWTVKDTDGYIEKLYEYNFESDSTKGDVIRRIREYSVYHDKDCFLENFSSRTVINESGCVVNTDGFESKALRSCKRIQNQRFLTESEAFQVFMQNTQNRIVPVTFSSKPPISYG